MTDHAARPNPRRRQPGRPASHSRPDGSSPDALRTALLDAAPGALVVIDLEGRVVECNAAATELFGYPRDAAFGRGFDELFVPPSLREAARAHLARYRDSGRSEWLSRRFAALATTASASELAVDVTVIPIPGPTPLLALAVHGSPDADGNGRAGEYHARLRSLAAHLLMVEETERRRLATDLHDGLCQTLALARLKHAALREAAGDALAAPMDAVAGLIEDAERSARSITFEISPPTLHDLGLAPALEWLVGNIRERYGLDIDLDGDGQRLPVDAPTRVMLFRAIRELLINAAKHSRAKHVHVRLRREADRVHASVEDDGVGMETGQGYVKGYGLFSIHERIEHAGGGMQVDSAPGRGTIIRLWAPFADPRAAPEGHP